MQRHFVAPHALRSILLRRDHHLDRIVDIVAREHMIKTPRLLLRTWDDRHREAFASMHAIQT